MPDLQIHLFTKLHQDRTEQCYGQFQVEEYRKLEPNTCDRFDQLATLDDEPQPGTSKESEQMNAVRDYY